MWHSSGFLLRRLSSRLWQENKSKVTHDPHFLFRSGRRGPHQSTWVQAWPPSPRTLRRCCTDYLPDNRTTGRKPFCGQRQTHSLIIHTSITNLTHTHTHTSHSSPHTEPSLAQTPSKGKTVCNYIWSQIRNMIGRYRSSQIYQNTKLFNKNMPSLFSEERYHQKNTKKQN